MNMCHPAIDCSRHQLWMAIILFFNLTSNNILNLAGGRSCELPNSSKNSLECQTLELKLRGTHPHLVFLIGHLDLSGVQLGVAPITGTKKDIVLKRNWTACSKYDDYSRLSSQHNWRYLYDHFISTRTFILEINKIIHMSTKIIRKLAMALIWIC